MDETNQNSSTNVILAISAALIAIVAGGWFFLDSDDASAPSVQTVAPALPEEDVAATDVASELSESPSDPELQVAKQESQATEPAVADAPDDAVSTSSQIESDLRKARLAAEADILTDPADQSALHYYALVLDAEPGHDLATAELNEVLARLNMTATALLATEDYAGALRLADKVALVRPDHALVNEVQQTLDGISGDFVTQAMQRAEAGDGDAALAFLAQAEALPGRNAQYFQAVRESVGDLLKEKADAQAEAEESERAATARATAAWMQKVRTAISDGNLIAPPDESALDFIEERATNDEIAGQLRDELLSAILADASRGISEGDFDRASQLLDAAPTVDGDSSDIEDLKAALNNAYIARESARVLPITELTPISKAPASYPRRAEERGISGWVELVFTVSPAGNTEDIVVTGAEPKSIFNRPALEAVEQWTFEPRQFRGQAIAQRATVKLVFQLR